ncbi:MAG: hypothetical protein M3Z09_12585 [Acidobacteriota bacterium]|nr:hypothetical protein [Acidobacteriota bacterium]
MLRQIHLLGAATIFVCGGVWSAVSQEVRPGVSAAKTPDVLPLPTDGYEAFLVGELHGLEENELFQVQYLTRLHRAAGLRDVAIEEDAVYESDAQAFVDGRSNVLPPSLCLRAGLLEAIRRLNVGLDSGKAIRVHLTDIDSPAIAILQHLLIIKNRLEANQVSLPNEAVIKQHGLRTVGQLKRLTKDSATLSELRTIELSVLAYRQGLEIDTGPSKGSPYLDSREQAVASNIVDLIRARGISSLLVIYGSDHVSRTLRKDGGPNRDRPFIPMARRLEQSGIKAYSLVTLPLAGRSYWRGSGSELPWTATDGQLASGESFDRILSALPDAQFLYIDTKSQRARLPTQDFSKMTADAFLLFRSGSPMQNHCETH